MRRCPKNLISTLFPKQNNLSSAKREHTLTLFPPYFPNKTTFAIATKVVLLFKQGAQDSFSIDRYRLRRMNPLTFRTPPFFLSRTQVNHRWIRAKIGRKPFAPTMDEKKSRKYIFYFFCK
jgi:hypothetical protein